ncbi:MAG: uroporphyrinogen-III synthase [Pseudomonadota bacterium]
MTSASKRPTILVTRPEPGATKTADALSAMGFEPLVLPFTELHARPISADAMGRVQSAKFVVVTSANAVRFAPKTILSDVGDLPVFAVGNATAEAARLAGFDLVESVEGDADTLISRIAERRRRGESALYLCGRVRKAAVETGLAKAGIEIIVAETYETQKVSQLTDKFVSLIARHAPDAILVFSAFSGRILTELLDATRSSHIPENTTLFAISEQVENSMRTTWRGPLIVAKRMDADAMHNAVREHFFSPDA